MKFIAFLSGAIFTFLTSAGVFLKFLSWSLGATLMTIGISGFVLVFLPLLMMHYLKSIQMMITSQKLLLALGVGSLTLVGAAFVLKINHIYGSNLAIGIGGILFSVGFVPALFYALYRNAAE